MDQRSNQSDQRSNQSGTGYVVSRLLFIRYIPLGCVITSCSIVPGFAVLTSTNIKPTLYQL